LRYVSDLEFRPEFCQPVTGNPVISKPHPKAVYPIALVLAHIQDVLVEKGLAQTSRYWLWIRKRS